MLAGSACWRGMASVKGWCDTHLTRPPHQPDTAGSLKSTSSTPAHSLQGRFFCAPHSARRASARPARSLGVSGIRKDPDALVRVESTPTPFRVALNLEVQGGYMPNKVANVRAAVAAIPMKIETPLVCASGDTTPVSVALGFLATVLRGAEPGEVLSLNYDDCCGLSYLLDTCAAAIEAVNNPDYMKGGAA